MHPPALRETRARPSRLPALGLLAALALTACGTTDSRDGGTSGSQDVVTPPHEAMCEVKPPFAPNFEPELEWQWTGSTVLPEHKQVMMTPVVVDVNGDGVPDIVFNAYQGNNYNTDGVLRALSGDDGHELWTVTDPAYRVRAAASLAAGDIDNDGKVELCTVPESGSGIICFENDGTFKFRTSVPTNNWGGVSFADLDGDGKVEILDGNFVFSNTGALKWVGEDGPGGPPLGAISFAADVDNDGKLEVINDRAIYRADGSLKCRNTAIDHGLAGVGNFDDDDHAEIVVVWGGRVSLMNDDCSLKWTAVIPGGGFGGAPNIADFDNDGMPEIGVAGASQYVVFDGDGSVKWSAPTQDVSSNMTGSSTFDFEGDGKAEVVYADEVKLRIYDGATGAVRFEVPHSSCTTYENPVIADVDGDDNAEVVVVENTSCGYGANNGIRVYRDKKDGWVNTRRIWNQHAYAVTNVNDDGTIPAHPAANWLTPGLNTFRSNSQGSGTTSAFAAPDVTVSGLSAECAQEFDVLTLSATVTNQGDAATSAGLHVAFYSGNPASGGTRLGVATVPGVLAAKASALVTLQFHPSPGGSAEVFAVADDDGTGTGREAECDEGNNSTSAPLNLNCSANAPPVAVCRNITVNADARCLGGASVNNGSHDPDQKPGALSISESPTGPFGLGAHAVLLTASDGRDSARCTGTVTVVDAMPPAIVCPASQVLECGPGAAATYSARATDNCGAAPTTCAPGSGASFSLGTTPVTCSATDGSGNTASCGFTVTVRDTTPPTIACPAPQVLECTQGGAVATYSPQATDTCGAASTACSRPSGSSFPAGTTNVTCTARDDSGNTASCAFPIIVRDTQPPVVSGERGLFLWPPNHQYVPVSLEDCAGNAQDTCGGELPLNQYGHITRVTSDEVEDDNGNGDGHTCGDILLTPGASSVQLRSEREGTSDGRVYTLYYTVKDASGNSTSGSCRVNVPHDQSGRVAEDSGTKYCVGDGCPDGTSGGPLCQGGD